MRERNLNQKIPKTNKAPRPPLEPAKTRASRKPKQPRPKKQKIQQQKGLSISYYLEYHLWSLLTPLGKYIHIDAGEPPQKDCAQESTQINHPQNKSIESWISACAQLVESEELLESPSVDIPPSARAFVSRLESKDTSAIAPSKRSKVAVSVGDSNFRSSLLLRNILINEDLPVPLLKRATEIISNPNESFEMDEDTALKLKRIAKRVATKGEDALIQQLGILLFPAMIEVPDPQLAAAINGLWDQTVAVPLKPFESVTRPPLPRPRPDLTFGYSGEAFDGKQSAAFGFLVIEEAKQSFAMQVDALGFPFLQIEFKAFATGGNPFVAENQAANAGAIAMHGLLELHKRNSAKPNLDFDSPQFFSLTINNKFASVNVHWLSHSAKDGSICYNMATLSDHLLTESSGLQKVHQTVKNILHYAVSERLPRICEALDMYMQNIFGEQEKDVHGRDSASESQAEEQQILPRQLSETHPPADRPAKRRRLGHPAQGHVA